MKDHKKIINLANIDKLIIINYKENIVSVIRTFIKYRIQLESDSIKLYNTVLILSSGQIIEIIIKNDKEE